MSRSQSKGTPNSHLRGDYLDEHGVICKGERTKFDHAVHMELLLKGRYNRPVHFLVELSEV